MSNQRLSDFPSRAIPLLAYAAGDAFSVFYEFLKVPEKNVPQELRDVYLLYAMDATAKEAVKVAMDSNGYALNLGKDEAMQDEGAWGQIDNVVLLDPTTGQPTKGDDGSNVYNSFVEAISKGGWEPGEGYSFIVRDVPARKKAMDLEALLRALDQSPSMICTMQRRRPNCLRRLPNPMWLEFSRCGKTRVIRRSIL